MMDATDHKNAIASAVAEIVSSDRIKSIEARSMVNQDDMAVLWVTIVYDANNALTQVELEQITDAAWGVSSGAQETIPVIDFKEDTDREFLAAE